MFIHVKISMFTTEKRKKTGMLYILKLVCLLQKYGKNEYVVHIKTSMFTTEIRKKQYVVQLKPSMFTTKIRKKPVCCTY